MIQKKIIYVGAPMTVACDEKCDKAWGINNRPRISFDPADEDDMALFADGECGTAPADPGTTEGEHSKPVTPSERLNKWCVRECERSVMLAGSHPIKEHQLPDFTRRRYNQPSKHPDRPNWGGDGFDPPPKAS